MSTDEFLDGFLDDLKIEWGEVGGRLPRPNSPHGDATGDNNRGQLLLTICAMQKASSLSSNNEAFIFRSASGAQNSAHFQYARVVLIFYRITRSVYKMCQKIFS